MEDIPRSNQRIFHIIQMNQEGTKAMVYRHSGNLEHIDTDGALVDLPRSNLIAARVVTRVKKKGMV